MRYARWPFGVATASLPSFLHFIGFQLGVVLVSIVALLELYGLHRLIPSLPFPLGPSVPITGVSNGGKENGRRIKLGWLTTLQWMHDWPTCQKNRCLLPWMPLITFSCWRQQCFSYVRRRLMTSSVVLSRWLLPLWLVDVHRMWKPAGWLKINALLAVNEKQVDAVTGSSYQLPTMLLSSRTQQRC